MSVEAEAIVTAYTNLVGHQVDQRFLLLHLEETANDTTTIDTSRR